MASRKSQILYYYAGYIQCMLYTYHVDCRQDGPTGCMEKPMLATANCHGATGRYRFNRRKQNRTESFLCGQHARMADPFINCEGVTYAHFHRSNMLGLHSCDRSCISHDSDKLACHLRNHAALNVLSSLPMWECRLSFYVRRSSKNQYNLESRKDSERIGSPMP